MLLPTNSPPPISCKACEQALDKTKSRGEKNGFSLLPCPQCGTITVDPFPTDDFLHVFYQSYVGTADYRAKGDKKIRRSLRRIKRMAKISPGKTFLDVGCNYGFAVAAALQLGLDAHGIDIDAAAIEINKETFGPSCFSAVSVQDFAARKHKFNMVYTSEVIEHVPDPDSFIKSIAALLTEGGILYLTTPDAGHFSLPRRFTDWKGVMPPEHIVYFTRRGIKHLLNKHGLKVRKMFFNFKPGIHLLAEKL